MDDKKPAPEAEDAVMQQSYPSPIVDGADAQYYQLTSHRDHDQEQDQQQMDHQPGQPGHNGLSNLPEHQEQHEVHGLPNLSEHQGQHEHHGLHELHELQEPSTPQQHNPRPSVSADELQLAAQLTQGLAPMMAAAQMAAVQDQTQDQQSLQQQEPEVQPQSDHNLEEQLEASLQNHERGLQGHGPDLQNHNHELENHGLQDVLPHPGQQQAHHYSQNPPPPPHLPPHMSMEHLPPGASQYQLPDTTPPRKRSKVSRACDECRRKKIKCDAQSEATDQPCSNCRRSNAQCLFSRIPQKRGPSKGYIKELADRINTIEGKLNTGVEGPDTMARRASSEAFASPGMGDESRKRPFSSISGDGFHTPSPSRISAGYTTDHRPILPYVQPEFRPPNSGNPNELAMKPVTLMPFPGGTNEASLQAQPEPIMDGMSQNDLPQSSSHQTDQLPEIEDAVFDRYLEVIHPTFPVLASTKARVQSLLWQSPFTLQSAFYNAFFSMLKPFLPASNSQANGDALTASRLLSEWEAEGRPRSTVTDLVRLQTLVMVAIAADCQGIALVKGQLGSPSKAETIGRAVGLGYSMKLYLREVDPVVSPELDPNSDDNVALRAWWVLVMLDRWNAVGTATPTLINNDSVVVLPGLKHILGDVVFTLIRMSYALGFIIPLAIHPPADPLPSSGPTLSSMMTLATELLRWTFPTEQTDPILHLSYWHIRLLSELLPSPSIRRRENVLQCAKKLVDLLAGNHDLLSPLTHHFVVLASLALLDLVANTGNGDDDGARSEEAARLGKRVLEFSLSPSPWNTAVREKLAARLLDMPARLVTSSGTGNNAAAATTAATSVGGGGSSQNLQQLADLATAVESSAAGAGAAGTDAAAGEEAPAPAPAASAVKTEDTAGGGGGSDAQAGVDVLAMLRAGYLTCFEESTAVA